MGESLGWHRSGAERRLEVAQVPAARTEGSAMYTDVITGFDGSAAGRDALALGRRLALTTGASTTVVCVHPYKALTAEVAADSAIELSWRRGAEVMLEEARRTLDDVPDVTFRAKPETSPARALHEIAREAAAAV